MQKAQAGPGGAQICTFSAAAGNISCRGAFEYSELGCYRILFEITLANGKKRTRFLDPETSEDATKWKPRNRLGHLKRILRNEFTPEPHAFWEAPRDNTPLGALGLWLGPSVRSDLNKVCIVTRADGEGPWDLRSFNAGHRRSLFHKATSPSRQTPPQRVTSKPVPSSIPATQPSRPANAPRRASESSQLRRGSKESIEETVRTVSASNRRPNAVSQKSQYQHQDVGQRSYSTIRKLDL